MASAVPAEPGVEFQRARHDLGAEERAGGVADQHDLLGVAAAHDVAQILREAVEPFIPLRTLAM